MKSILLSLAFFCTSYAVVAQSFILDFEMKKSYGAPFVFTDSSTHHAYFVFIRKEAAFAKAAVCIIETDSLFHVLRQSETTCDQWAGSIVFQEINDKHLLLYIVETNTIFKPLLAKLQIDRKTLTYYFDKVVSLELGDNLSYLRGLSDGTKHYVINVLHSSKSDSLLVLKIENGVSQGVQRYLLPDVSDFNETWKSIFKDKFALFGPSHPLMIVNPTDNPNIATGFSDNKLYLTNDQLVFTMKFGDNDLKRERIVKVDCDKKTISTNNVTFLKPKSLEYHTSNAPNSTASVVTDNYLFQAWTNGETGVLVAKTVDSLKEIRRWEFTEQDTFNFKNSPIHHYLANETYWFADKKKPFKTSKDLMTKMLDDGFLLTARKQDNAIKVQFGTYKYVNEAAKRVALGVGLGIIGGTIAAAAVPGSRVVVGVSPSSGGLIFPDYERATYFWMDLKGRELSQTQNSLINNHFDQFCEKTKSIYTATITNYFSIDGRRAILYLRRETQEFGTSKQQYCLYVEEK